MENRYSQTRTPSFHTERLVCYPLLVSDYSDFAAGREPHWSDFTNPFKHLIEGPSPLAHRIPRVKTHPLFAEIGLILAVQKSTMQIIGSAGFHDLPDKNGMIEVGFGIVDNKQNNGFGTELLIGMWKMICQRSDVQTLRYTVSPENAPSMHIVKKMGFTLKGEQIDPEDGVELIYEQSVQEFRARQRNSID